MQLRQQLALSSGFRIPELDNGSAQAFVQSRIRALQLDGPAAYIALLESAAGAVEAQQLALQFSSLESYFLRDHGQIDLLRQTLLPQLLEARRALRSLRIWSAGCSSGEEAYTLATLVDALVPDREDWTIRIVATDINPQALQRAALARYGEWSFRGCSDAWRQLYFRRDGELWQLDDRIRRMVSFSTGDLLHDPLPSVGLSDFDLIVCRNVLIYFSPDSLQLVARKLAACLRPGGVLMTGHGELFTNQPLGLQTEVYPDSLVFRKAELVAVPASAPWPTAPPVVNHKAGAAPVQPKPAVEGAPVSRDAAMAQAWQLADSNQSEAALRQCRDIAKRFPLDAGVHYLQAVLYLSGGQFEMARQSLRRAIYLEPDMIAAYMQLAELQVQSGHAAEAQRSWAVAAGLLRNLGPQTEVPLLRGNRAGVVLAYVEGQMRAQ